MPDPVEAERLGRPYFICPECPFSGMDRGTVAQHMRDHEPRPTLDEVLHPPEPAAPEPTRKRKE